MTDVAKISIEADTKGLTKGATALKNFQLVGAQTEKSILRNTNGMTRGLASVRAPMMRAGDAAAAATPKMKGFGNSARQASMQLSQVAQQGSVTGNYLQALAIQLPDLMLGFGTLGILIGAAAGALAVFFVNAARKAGNASNDLKEEIDGLAGEYEDLAHAERELLKIKIAEETIALSKSTKSLNDDIRNSVLAFDSLSRQLARGSIDALEYAEATDEITRKNSDLRAEIARNNRTIQDRNDLLNETARKEEEAAEAATKAAALRERLEADLLSVQQGFESPAERAQREADERAMIIQTAQDQELSSTMSYAELKKANAQRLSEELLAIERKEQAQKNQILTAGQQASLSIIGGLFGQMAAIAQKGGEEQFQAYKNLATAQALISTSLAVANTLANPLIPPPFNFALAGAVGVMGAVQVGMIRNQQYQGTRAMGGQVEAGGSFLVGENGPEVLQLGGQGGSITPNHALDSGGGATVTTIVNIQAGVTKSEVTSLIPSIVNASIAGVKSEIAKGGTMSKAVGRRA